MDNIQINRLNPDTFEYQTYDVTDESLIAISNLDTAFTASTDYIEYYIYDQSQSLIFPSTTIPLTNYDIRDGDVLLNPPQNLSSSGFDIGTYNIYYSFYRKRLSSNNIETYFISEISADRTEIRLDSNLIDNQNIISSSNSFIQYREESEYFVDFYLNFGSNQTIIANNLKLEADEDVDPTILIKLYDPLPNEFDLKSSLWVVELLSAPQLYEVNFPFEPIVEDDFTYLKGPNYSLNIVQQTGTPGQEFSYSTLINSDITSSTNQIKSLLNEKDINININYENYSNFVKFSSAKTRLENFYYKVGLIESSSAEISASLGQISSQTTSSFSYSSSIATLSNQIDDIIKNFDGYEYFLYFNSGSLYSYPKSNTSPPFTLYSTGSTEVLEWIGSANPGNAYYGGQALSASNYDAQNKDYLFYTIPEYLRSDPENRNYELFVDMVGQYYDNTWVYAKDITNKFDADNRLDFGISKDLVSDAIKEFAVNLYSNNFNTDDLYLAFLGLTPSGSSFPVVGITGSLPIPSGSGLELIDTEVSASNNIVPLDDVNKSLYKRIYHNIPYLLKTKGTIAGIRALITAYGIPDTILRISEFGGKDRNEAQDYDLRQDVFNYAFDTGNGASNYLTSSFNSNAKFNSPNDTNSPETVQFRFKSSGIPTASANTASSDIRYSQSLWVSDTANNSFASLGAAVVLEYTGSGFVSGSYSGSSSNPYDTWGTLKFYPDILFNPTVTCSVFAPFFNKDWWSVQLTATGSGTTGITASLFAANEIDGKIGFSGSQTVFGLDSRSYNRSDFAALNYSDNFTINSKIYQPFSGSYQEYRMFVPRISESKFFDYTVNPYSDEGNTLNSTPNELFFRADLGTQLDTGSTTSIHPRVTGSSVQITQSFTNDSSFFISNKRFVTNKEFIYQDQVVAGMKNRITEKVVLKSGSLAEAPYGYNTNVTDVDGDFIPTQGKITASALSPMRSMQQYSYTSQSYTPNVNYLEVAFSPSNQINDDINAQLGYFNIGDYIGDPRLISSSDTSYPSLDRLRDAYFEKYYASYDVRDFVRLIKFFDNSLFKMIKDFTPARTSLASGVVVKQHILERNRQRPAQVTSSMEMLSGSVKPFPKDYNTGSSDFPQYATSGSAIYKFSGGPGGVMNKFNGLQSYPSGSDGTGPNNNYYLTQSYNVNGTAREPNDYSIINSTYFNYSSSQFLSASYQGLGVSNVATQHEFYDGEFSGSKIIVTTQSLNPDCAPYLNVVDKGALYNPIFYNSNLSRTIRNGDGSFTFTNYPGYGTVSSKAFNDPDNEPNPGDAWLYSEVISNPDILLRLGLPTNGAISTYNYVTSIKLAKVDINGNDISDFIIGSDEIQIVLPDANITGDLITTFKIVGIIIERNSIFLRVAIDEASNRFVTVDSTDYFPITSSNVGGSENWSFKAHTQFTSSDSLTQSIDLSQQNNFSNPDSLDQTQFVTSYLFPQSLFGVVKYTASVGSNAVVKVNSLGATAEPSVYGGEQINMFVQGGLNQSLFIRDINRKDVSFSNDTNMMLLDPYNSGEVGVGTGANGGNDFGDFNFWNYGAFILKRTPNVPLNFSMSIQYETSGSEIGGGPSDQFNTGFLLSGSGYNKNASGNTPQGLTLGGSTVARQIYITTASFASVSDALNVVSDPTVGLEKGSANIGYIEATFLTVSSVVYSDRGLSSPINNLSPNQYFGIFITSSQPADTTLVYEKGAARAQSGVGNMSGFQSLFQPSGASATKIVGGTLDTAVSTLFTPSTATETVSSNIFDDTLNPLLPGRSGSHATDNPVIGPPPIPRFSVPATSSIAYNFGAIQFSGSFTPSAGTPVFEPLSGSALKANNNDWDGFSPNAVDGLYWYGPGTTNDYTFSNANNSATKDGRYAWSSSIHETNWEQLAVSNIGQVTNVIIGDIDPYFTYTIVTGRDPGSTLNATASIQYWDDNNKQWVEESGFRANHIPLSTTSTWTNPGGGGSNTLQLGSFSLTTTTVLNVDINLFNNNAFRVVIKSDNDFQFYMTQWDIDRVKFGYAYEDPFGSGNYVLAEDNLTSNVNGTANSDGLGVSLSDNNAFDNNAFAQLTGSIKGEAFLKYTGSIYDANTTSIINVDTVLTSSGQLTFSGTQGTILNFSGSDNPSGHLYNPSTYDTTDLATTSSTLALSGGMYYIEYSMSEFGGLSPTSFTLNLDYNQSLPAGGEEMFLFVGTTSSGAGSSIESPSASITPLIYYGNQEDIIFAPDVSSFGSAVSFDSNYQNTNLITNFPAASLLQSQSIIVTTGSTGTFTVTGSFYPQDNGWNVNDTLRFAIRVRKQAGNISVKIPSASWGFSPDFSFYTQEFSPSTWTASNEAQVRNMNEFQSPTQSDFAIPTFFGSGVAPFASAIDCQPLIGNYNLQRPSSYIMDVDYNNASGPIIPVNQEQILKGIAVKAAVPDSNYSSKVWTVPRYTGSRSICRQTNIFTYGDIGTYGQLPNIEIRFAYFAYFGSIVNPYPLYNDVTQLNVTYLIDEQSNALPPSLQGLSYEIMSQLYPAESTVQISVNSGSDTLNELSGYQTVYDIGRLFRPIVYSQTSSNAYTGRIPLSGSGRISIYDNASDPAARTVYGMSVMGQGVSVDEGANARSANNILNVALTPGYLNTSFEIQSGSNNDASGSGMMQAPYSASSTSSLGGFVFTSSIDNVEGADLRNPQRIYIEQSFHTTFLYESGTDEMETQHKLKLIRDGETSNIPFELDSFTLDVKYLGKKVSCGSVLGQIQQGGGWRDGTMLQFVTGNPTSAYRSGDPNNPAAGNFGLTNDNTMRVLYENPVYKALLTNRGVNWKPHGGINNGGPVEYSIWTIKINTGDFIFKAGDRVYLEFTGKMSPRQGKNIFYPPSYPDDAPILPVNYSVIGANDTVDGDNAADAPFWRFSGSNPDQKILEMSSSNFNEAYGNAWSQGNLEYVPGPSPFFESGIEPLGTKFPRITNPLEIKENDQIRFVNNETYTYNILEVIPPQENIDSNGVAKLKIRLDKEVPSGSVNLDFFLVRRPYDDAGIVYLNGSINQNIGLGHDNISGSVFSSGGNILPEFPSEGISISSSQIVNNLISKGVIQS